MIDKIKMHKIIGTEIVRKIKVTETSFEELTNKLHGYFNTLKKSRDAKVNHIDILDHIIAYDLQILINFYLCDCSKKDIILILNDIYNKKNKDYGDSFAITFKEYGITMSCIRLEDKLNRFDRLSINKERYVEDEKISDTLLDLANYSIMTIIELMANPEKVNDNEYTI